jgi:hypothetical protein
VTGASADFILISTTAKIAPAPQALDDAAARRLWEASEVLLARLHSLPQD